MTTPKLDQLPIVRKEDIETYVDTYKTKEIEDFIGKYKMGKPIGGSTMGDLNLCIPGIMSICSAADIKKTDQRVSTQGQCDFFEKARFVNKCMYEVFEEFCGNVEAQRAAKGN